MANSLRAKPLIERADELLSNSTLRLAKRSLRDWQSTFVGCDASVLKPADIGTTIQPTRSGHLEIWQEIRAYTNRRYRLDVHAEAVARHGTKDFVAQVHPQFTACKAGKEIRAYEPPTMQVGADAPAIHRAYFQCPEGTGRLQVRLRICVRQAILVKRIRLVECGDYLPQGHPLAIPPEPWREMPPCLPDSVLLCDGRKDKRLLLSWLQTNFGNSNVRRIAKSALASAGCHGPVGQGKSRLQVTEPIWPQGRAPATGQDSRAVTRHDMLSDTQRPALVVDLPAEQAPSLQDLLAWSDNTIVIASLQTFAGAAQQSGIKGVQLQDRICGVDMPAGTVMFSGYYTRGLALADAIPYCWNDGQDDFAHRYLVVPKPAKAQLADLGIHVSLVSETGQQGTRKHPIAFCRSGRSGALIVMDPDGLEAPSAGDNVPRMFDPLWRSALGCDTVTLGQLATPAPHYQGVMTDIVEVAKHFDMLEDLSPPVRLRGLGNPPTTWLWPGKRADRFSARKTLLVRTGFSADDWPAIYGLILWLKRVALKSHVNEPVVRLLQQNLRVLAWPITHPRNWRGCPENVTAPQTDLLPADLAGLIDLAVGDERHTVILMPDAARAAILQRCLGPSWPWETEVVVAPQAFADEPLAQQAGAEQLVCRVLLPGVPQPHHADSPALTDLPACLLERLAFGTIGWMVPNRTWRPMQLSLPSMPRARKIVQIDAAGDRTTVTQRRGALSLPPGAAILGLVD